MESHIDSSYFSTSLDKTKNEWITIDRDTRTTYKIPLINTAHRVLVFILRADDNARSTKKVMDKCYSHKPWVRLWQNTGALGHAKTDARKRILVCFKGLYFRLVLMGRHFYRHSRRRIAELPPLLVQFRWPYSSGSPILFWAGDTDDRIPVKWKNVH